MSGERLPKQHASRPDSLAPVTSVTGQRVSLPAVKTLILRIIDASPDDTFTLGQLAGRTGRKKTAVKVGASRLFREGRLRRVDRGLYQSVFSRGRPTLPDPRLRIHALKLECRYREVGWPYRQVFQRVSTVWASPALHRHRINHGLTGSSEWRARRLTWTIHEGAGLLEVFLEASRQPLHLVLDVPSFLASVETASGIPGQLWLIRQADWNIDIPGSVSSDLAVRVGEGLSITEFATLMAKVYQQAAELVRTEVRSFHPLSGDEISGYIRSIFNTVEEIVRRRPNGTPVLG